MLPAEYIKLAVEHSPFSAMVVDTAEARTLFINRTFSATIGYTLNEIPTVKRWMAAAYPDPVLREQVAEIWKRNLEEGGTESVVFPVVCKNLSTRLIEFHAAFLPEDLAVLTLIDVTKQERDREALHESEARFQSVFEQAAVGISLSSPGGRLLRINPMLCNITGYTGSELEGRPFQDLIHPEEKDRYMENLEALQADNSKRVDTDRRLINKDGHIVWTHLSGTMVFDSAGMPQYIVTVYTDITERRRAQELMIQTEKMMSVGGLAAGMAHEINNPLGIILQGAQGLERRVSPDIPGNRKAAERTGIDLDRLQDYLRERGVMGYILGIREAGERAAAIVRNMLNFSRRSDSGKTSTDLNRLIENTISLASNDYDLKKRFDFRHIQINKELDPALPEIFCNRTEIEQVLLNLLRNAAQAVGGPGKADGAVTLRSRSDSAKNRVIIEVEDNGPGLDDAAERHALEPFFTTKEPGMGTGLGLSVSYFIIVRNHGGDFRLETPPGSGVRAIVELPVKPIEQQ